MAEQEQNKKISFKDTLNLPRTDFPIRSNAAQDDPALVARWQNEHLYHQAFIEHPGKEKFILHDGPPYANGHLHIGHAYNKILKDIVTKSYRMRGMHVPVTPGWDCHGLPIELAVTKKHPDLDKHELKKECRRYAQEWVNIQRDEFKRLGVVMNWDNPYLTMNFSYEASIVRAFGEFVAQGYIERKNKTVPWCFSCQTVLAAAEIEYHDRKDPSVYVLFPLEQSVTDALLPALSGKSVNLLIWTTTPWTLPLNRAVLVKPDADYVVFEHDGSYIAVGKSLAKNITDQLGTELALVATFKGSDLMVYNPKVHHPFIPDLMTPVLPSETVMLDEGTAFVHCAPGCGPEDYEIGIRNNLEIYSPVGADGRYTNDIIPAELAGMPVTDGQIWVLKKLKEVGSLLLKKNITHSYSHCWRCHTGLIFRATKQWFCDLSKNNLKVQAVDALETLDAFPPKSINRLKATVEGRLEWCLSRQRIWGVPIPALICTNCDAARTDKEFIDLVAYHVETEGVEYWDTVDIKKIKKDVSCTYCGSNQFKKETDILDVWFDSGISHYAVLLHNPPLRFPADMYLEGKDQHRGWFQSSLLTALVLEGKAPMKQLLTHGFTVDEKGHKMSKSLGNVVSPEQMIEQLGTDGLRLWATSIDYADDAVVSPTLIRNVQEVLRKIRNTSRFLLSNLYDFDKERDAVPLDQLLVIDQYALTILTALSAQVLRAYEQYDFTTFFHLFAQYCSVQMSSFYLDIIKDRLYVEKSDGHERRSAQTACWYLLDTLTKLSAPVLSFNAEYISDHYQKNKKTSIHLQEFASPDTFAQKNSQALQYFFDELKEIRDAVLKNIETLREQGTIKHSLEARVILYINQQLYNLADFYKLLNQAGQIPVSFFKEFFIVSQVELRESDQGLSDTQYPGVHVAVEKARGIKCPRCWQWQEESNEHGLCNRCHSIIVNDKN